MIECPIDISQIPSQAFRRVLELLHGLELQLTASCRTTPMESIHHQTEIIDRTSKLAVLIHSPPSLQENCIYLDLAKNLLESCQESRQHWLMQVELLLLIHGLMSPHAATNQMIKDVGHVYCLIVTVDGCGLFAY